ncbi:type-F conjugative transfer system secretin TraK [Endozoicomonas sp. ONNA1]|uniref:type-F conjugative transfer system secretin TraK n=1 Tax=Endozoicomonas sp. ONNA1 TaxID=2828740 RepID=UPI0021494E87|nr:type-F conjugative transfer system secretin TraK [Endozoicomonas sp. ONNA1]
MMRRTLFLIFMLFTVTVHASTLMPETTHHVTLSNRDVNRIVCQTGAINDVYFSQEKAITVKTSGSNVFVKFLVRDDGTKKDYVTSRSEFYVVCDGEVYTLIATPKTTDARTVHLGNPIKNKIQTNIELLSPLDLEEQAVTITRRVMTGNIPDSFNVQRLKKDWINFKDTLRLRPVRRVTIEGIGLNLIEYQVATFENRQLNEYDFLDTSLSSNIIAVTVHPLKLMKGQTARLFIVEKEIN